MASYEKKDNEVVMLEQQRTNDDFPEKSVPAIAKVDYSGAYEKTDPREIALVKKLDRWIMPMLWSMYWLNYLDRNAIALARLDDLEEDLNLTSTQYQTCVSILFVGYLLGQIPSNMFLNRTRPSRYMGVCMMLWAVVSALTALAKDFKGLLLTRFFLGVTEAPYYPGAVYLLSMFYNRKEVATRIAILYTGNILATAFAGLIAAGIFHGLGDVAGISGWQWLFILQGIVTFLIAIVGYFLLPDFPHNTWWLTQAERDLAVSRMAIDTVGKSEDTSVWTGFRQAAKDPMVWVFAFMAHMHLAVSFAPFDQLYLTNRLPGERLQELFPHCRSNARLQHHHHSRSHLPTLPHRWRSHYRRLLVIRKVQRAHMAHHHLQDRCYHWFPCCMRASRCCRSLRRHGYFHHRYIWCQLSYSRLVRIHLWSDS